MVTNLHLQNSGRKKDMVFDLVRLINERVITFDDLEEFSDELREYVEFIQQRLSY